MKICRKFCECLKNNAKFREGWAIFGIPKMWTFYVKYYKTIIQKFEEKCKKYFLTYSAHASTVLSVLHFYLLVLVPYFATSGAPFARIHEYTKLYVNDGFLHSFYDFSRSNAFSENLITKFILYKIFFRMSIFSSSKTSWIFFNLH